jgi:hypothetical protein
MNRFYNEFNVCNVLWSEITKIITKIIAYNRLNEVDFSDYSMMKSSLRWLRKSAVARYS